MTLKKEQLVKETATELKKYIKTHSIFYVTIKPKIAFLQQLNKSDRVVAVQMITESFIRELQSSAIKKPLLIKNKHLLIDAYCVAEALSKYKQVRQELLNAKSSEELEDKLNELTDALAITDSKMNAIFTMLLFISKKVGLT